MFEMLSFHIGTVLLIHVY